MNEELKSKLMEFKSLTNEIARCLEQDNLEDIQALIDKRGEIIEEVNKLEFDKEELRSLFEELEILSLHRELQTNMNLKKAKIKNELLSINKHKQAVNGYNKNFFNNSFFIKKNI